MSDTSPTRLPPLTCQRDAFSLPPDVCYLNSAYMGPLPQAVRLATERALSARTVPVDLTSGDFFAPAEAARRACAALVGADPERTALMPTVAYAIATAVQNLPIAAGQTVVLLGEQFPSKVYSWRRLRDLVVRWRAVASPTPAEAAAAGRSAARLWQVRVREESVEGCRGGAVETAHWTDGTLFDLVAIGSRARAVGAALVVDATQTVGARPLDVAAIRPDLLVAHAYKSMLSHYGLGFAVLGERFADGRPLEESWLMRHGAEDFSRLVDYQDAYADGMRRYDTSLRANPMLILPLEAAATQLLAWQPARIAAYCRSICADFVDRVRTLGFGVAADEDRAANLFGLRLPPGLDPERVRAELATRRIHVSVRGSAVRVSPHVYNDVSDLAKLADALSAVVARDIARSIPVSTSPGTGRLNK